MRLKDIFNMAIFDVLLEGLGFIFAAGVILYLVFGGGFAEIAKFFAQAFCG